MATTTSYCRTSDVVKLLPDTLPNFLTTGSYGHMVEIIEETSALVRDACHNFYSAFPGTTDPLGTADLDTPARVKIITQYLAAQRCRDEIGVVQEKTQVGTYLHDKAMELLKEVLPRMNAAGEVIGDPVVRIENYWSPGPKGRIIQIETGEEAESRNLWYVE